MTITTGNVQANPGQAASTTAMRSMIASATIGALLVLTSTLAMTKPGCASTVINACGKFSFWVPDDWKESRMGPPKGGERTAFESKDGSLYVLAGALEDRSAILSDEDVTDLIDEEFDDLKITSDKKETLEKFDVRLIEGTGKDAREAIIFKALALDSGTERGVVMVVVSGSPSDMAEEGATIEKILRSLRPHR